MGRGITVRGELAGEGDVQIGGRVEGKVSVTGTVLIGEGATVEADVVATAIVIAGTVRGNLAAVTRVACLPTARLTGQIRSKVLVVEAGALLNGQLGIGATPVEGKDEDLAERVRQEEARGLWRRG
ncbi:MAG: polymer-forming cytoskeletal protein [Candidatus Methylomirabilales bacterium]